jgi:DNA-binding winged helix-turn-helix (wHTH) protein/TolB-like protein
MPTNSQIVRFGVFEANLRSRELSKRGVLVPLQDQPFQVLAALIEKPNQLVTRSELQQLLWPDVLVDMEVGLNNAVKKVRDALGDSVEDPHFIETLKGRGYRFLGEVSVVGEPAVEPELVSAPIPAPARSGRTVRVLSVLVPVGLVMAALLAWFYGRSQRVVFDNQTVFIAPLKIPGADADDRTGRLFSEGLAIDLSQAGEIHVLPVQSDAVESADEALVLAMASSRRNPRYILYGSLVRQGFATIVSLTLFDAAEERVLWGIRETLVGAGELSLLASRTST